MRQPISQLTQSRFYSPAFNAAIFDGALRIYFAQYQEALALKIYFRVQDRMRDFYNEAKQAFKDRGTNVFVMLYPTEETFQNSFSGESTGPKVVVERLGDDFVLGVSGPLRDEEIDLLFDQMEGISGLWQSEQPRPLIAAEA